MRVETLTPVVDAAPGARARWRLRVENDGVAPVGYRLRVVGFDPANVMQPPPRPPLEVGESTELDVELLIPEAFAAGRHAIAIELTPDRLDVAPVIASVTVTVGTIDDIAMAIVPSTIRARRRARFRVDLDNRSNEAREVELEADSAELAIEMRPPVLVLQPGERVRTSGRITGPQHLVGEPKQHSLTVAARSRSAPAYASATFQQRALFPRGLRTMLAVLLIVGIWGGALGAGFLWWHSRQDEEEVAAPRLVDIDGDGVAETPADQLVDTDGDGVPDTTAAIVAEQVAQGGQLGDPQPGGSDLQTRTSMGGTVAAADGGQAPDVDITLTPIDVGAPPPAGATQLGFRNGSLREVDGPPTAAKFWPARFGRYEPANHSGFRQTQAVPDLTTTDERGVWFFGSVAVGQSYEVSFAREGFDTQSFVVTPSADGKPIDLPVVMEPAQGRISGTVTGPSGGLGNVALTLTDGTLVFDSATASDGDVGTFSFTGISTPGTYSLLATAPGLGTEVVQVTLEEGERRGGVDIRMRAGVGSISGRITEDGAPLGGVTLTASNGDTTVETTSLTQGATGTYLFPRLEIGGAWTIEARLDGYLTQTRVVNLTGNATGVDFVFGKRTGAITGLVVSSNGGPLPGVNIRVSRDDLAFESQSAVAPDAGSFNIRDLPPGTYLVELSRYDHEPTSLSVTIDPGRTADLGTLTLVYRPRPDITQNGGMEVRVVDSEGAPIGPSTTAPGATVRVYRASDNTLVAEQVGAPDQSSFAFQPLPIGTYRVEVTRGVTYRLASRTVSVGLTVVPVVIPIYLLGQVHGRLIDSATGDELVDYDVQIRRLNPDGTTSIVQNLPVTVATPPKQMPDGTLERRFETANPPGLTSGQYEVFVDNAPPGYRVVPDQVLQPGQPPMQFQIRPDNDTPIDLGSILADRYQEVQGVVFAPRLGPDPGGDAARSVTFAPIDDNALRVTVTCPGVRADDPPSVLVLPNPDPAPPRPYAGSELTDTQGGPGLDSYFIDPVDIEELDLFGACTIEVAIAPAGAPGAYVPKTFDVFIDAPRGAGREELFRNVALVRDRDIAGTLFWVDDGPTPVRDVPASGVTVRLQGAATTGFDPGTRPVDSAGSDPTPVAEDIASVVTDGAGGWVFPDTGPAPDGSVSSIPRQVFDEARYVFERAPEYVPRIVEVTIDEDAVAVAPAPDSPPPPFALELSVGRAQLDANGADITGTLDIRTVKGSGPGIAPLDLTGFAAALSGANVATGALAVGGPYDGGRGTQPVRVGFGVTADPGTHQWTVTSPVASDPARPRFRPATAADGTISPTFFQAPAQPLDAASTPQLTKTYVEMGALDVEVVDTSGALIAGAAVDITTAGQPGIRHLVDAAAPIDNVERGLPVGLGVRESTTYAVALPQADNPRLNISRATVQVFGDNGAPLPGGGCTLGVAGCGTLQINQGGQPRVRITVPRYGTIRARVCGVVNQATTACETPLTLDPATQPDYVVEATLVGVPSPADATSCVTPPTAFSTTAVATTTAGEFEFFGPPGYYRVSVTHPDYDPIPGEFAAQESIDLQCIDRANPQFPPPDQPQIPTYPPLFAGQPVYRNRDDVNRTIADTWRLLRRRIDVTITVVNDSLLPTRGAPLAGADVTIQAQTSPLPPPIEEVTDADGRVRLVDDRALLPGEYTVEVRDDANAYFPLTLRFTILGGAGVSIDVPLFRQGGAIVGQVVAANSEGDALPAPVGVVVSDDYDAPDPAVTGASVLETSAPPTVGPVTAVAPAGSLAAGYEFTGLGSGTHGLSYAYDDTDGVYTDTPDPVDVTVVGSVPTSPDVPDAVYTAANRDVVVVVSATPDAAGAIVTLTDPDSPVPSAPVTVGACPAPVPPQGAYPAGALCAVFEDLPPEVALYRVTATKDLFAPATLAFALGVGPPTVPERVTLPMSGNTARVPGTAVRLEDEATPQTRNAVADGTTVELLRDGAVVQTTATSGGTGSFRFDITVPSPTYQLRTSVDGYVTRVTALPITSADLGRVKDPPVLVTVEKLATVAVAVTGPPAASLTGRVVPSGPGAPAPFATTRSGATLTADLDPQFSYRFDVSSPGYQTRTVPAVAVDPTIGQVLEYDLALPPRSISGTVAGGAGGSVRLLSTASPPAVVAGPVTIAGDGTYSIAGPVDAAAYTLVAERLGVGRGELPITVADTDGNRTGEDITLVARAVAVTLASTPAATVTIEPASGADIVGVPGTSTTLAVPENAWPITYSVTAPGYRPASSAAPIPLSPVEPADTWTTNALTKSLPAVTLVQRRITGSVAGTTDATVYAAAGGTQVGPSVPGAGSFDLGGPFEAQTYDVFAELVGTGWATTQVTFDSGDPDGDGVVDVGALALTPRPVDVTFPGLAVGVTITVTPAGGAPVSATTSTGTPLPVLSVDEDEFPIAWRTSAAGGVDSTGTAALTAGSATSWDDARLVQAVTGAAPRARQVSGTVAGTTGATVRAIVGTDTSAATAVGNVATGAGAFTLTGPFPVQTYTVVAEQLGVGRATYPYDVTASTTPSLVQPVTLTARTIAVTVTVTGTGAVTPNVRILRGATVVASGAPGTFSISETQFAGAGLTYEVTATGFRTATGAVPLTSVTDAANSWRTGAPVLSLSVPMTAV